MCYFARALFFGLFKEASRENIHSGVPLFETTLLCFLSFLGVRKSSLGLALSGAGDLWETDGPHFGGAPYFPFEDKGCR